MSFSMTAPKSLRELFDQLGLQEIPSTDGTVTMEMAVDERTVNTAGGLQGGLIATMADVTAGQLASRSTSFGMAIATTRLVHPLPASHQGRAGACGRADPAHGQALGSSCRWTSTGATTTRSGATATVNFAAVD